MRRRLWALVGLFGMGCATSFPEATRPPAYDGPSEWMLPPGPAGGGHGDLIVLFNDSVDGPRLGYLEFAVDDQAIFRGGEQAIPFPRTLVSGKMKLAPGKHKIALQAAYLDTGAREGYRYAISTSDKFPVRAGATTTVQARVIEKSARVFGVDFHVEIDGVPVDAPGSKPPPPAGASP